MGEGPPNLQWIIALHKNTFSGVPRHPEKVFQDRCWGKNADTRDIETSVDAEQCYCIKEQDKKIYK